MSISHVSRRLFGKLAAGGLAFGLPFARSQAQGPPYRLTFRSEQQPGGPCVSTEPRRLNVRKRTSPVVELEGHPSNPGPVQVTYGSDPSAIFQVAPQAPIVLQPGQVVRLVIRQDLGIRERGTFVDADPAYVRSMSFNRQPGGRCSDGNHDDMHIEC